MPTTISGTTGASLVQDSTITEAKLDPTIIADSVGTNGYAKLPGGLIVQWGTTSSSTGGTVTFPLAFTSACYAGMTTNATTGNQSLVSAKSTTQFTWSNSSTVVTNWIAVGY